MDGENIRKAWSALKTDECTGGIVFAPNRRKAMKIASAVFNNGEVNGLEVSRRKDLDRFSKTGVPAYHLINEGWRFECHGCGLQMTADMHEDHGLPVSGVVGIESADVCCSHACRMEALADKAARKAFGESFLDMLRDTIRKRLPGEDITFAKDEGYAYVPPGMIPLVVAYAEVRFTFPGMKFDPATLIYRHEERHGSTLIGPVRPEFFCSQGDIESFQAFLDRASLDVCHH